MDLVERYLSAVAAMLPAGQKADIVAELRDILLNRLEEREAELGRPLTHLEQEAVIQAFGHPIVAAGRYGPQQHLVGPSLYPLWRFNARLVLIIAGLTSIATGLVFSILHPQRAPQIVVQAAGDFIVRSLMFIGLITILGWLIERGVIKLKFLDAWRPSGLPAPKREQGCMQTRLGGVFELAASLLLLSWLFGVAPFPGGARWDGLEVFAPQWPLVRGVLIAMTVPQLIAQAVTVLAPAARKPRARVRLTANLFMVAAAAMLWRLRPVMVAAPLAGTQADPARLQAVLDLGVSISIAACVVVAVMQMAADGWRLVHSKS